MGRSKPPLDNTPIRPTIRLTERLRAGQNARQHAMLELAVAAGEALFDPAFGLCSVTARPDEPHIARKYNGHFVAWVSPAYAEALLATGRDLPRAARILERICDFLERDPGSPRYGNFFAVAEWQRVGDLNAVAFLSVSLGSILHRYGDRLPRHTRSTLEQTLRIATIGLVRRQADVFYTNIFLLCVAGKLLLGRLFQRADLLELAQVEWNAFMDRLARENESEFNSPSYQPVHAECLLTIRDFAITPMMRRQAEAALDYIMTLFCLHYHLPSRTHAGTMARCYRQGLYSQTDSTTAMATLLFGVPALDEWRSAARQQDALGIVPWSRHEYMPSSRLRSLFLHKPYPCLVRERNVCYWGRDDHPKIVERTHYQTETYSLATQYGVWANYGHYLPFLVAHKDGRRRTLFFQNEPHYPLIDAWFRQNADTALGVFFWGLPDYETFRSWWMHGPPFEALQLCSLGARDEMTALLLDGRPWDGRCQPRIGSLLEIRKPSIWLRLSLVTPPRGVRTPTIRMHTVQGDVAIHFTYGRSNSADRFWRLPPAILPVVFQIRSPENRRPWTRAHVRWSERNGLGTMTLGTLTADVPLTLAGRAALAQRFSPPLEGFLIESGPLTVSSAAAMRRRLRSRG